MLFLVCEPVRGSLSHVYVRVCDGDPGGVLARHKRDRGREREREEAHIEEADAISGAMSAPYCIDRRGSLPSSCPWQWRYGGDRRWEGGGRRELGEKLAPPSGLESSLSPHVSLPPILGGILEKPAGRVRAMQVELV